MSSSDQLRRAAAKLRETRAEVETGPPWAVGDDAPDLVCSGELRVWGAPIVASNLNFGDAAWIALMSPALAEPLAAWLESWDGVAFNERGPMADDLKHALNVARAILGEAS